MPATRTPTHAAAHVIAVTVLFLTTSTFSLGSGKGRADAAALVSGWNIDLVDIVETGQVTSATVSDPYVYATFGRVLAVIDVSNPGNPTRVGVALLADYCEDMELLGGYLYCHCQHTVEVVNVSIPSAPALVGSLPAQGNRVDADGNRLYVESWNGSYWLQVYDLTDPASPALLGTSAFAIGSEFEAHDGFVYSAHGSGGFRVIDATDPANPVIVGTLPTGSASDNVDVAFPYAYVVNTGSTGRGLYIIDVSNPAAPTQAGFYPSGSFPDFYEDVAVNGNRAYTTNVFTPPGATGTLDVFDVSNPAAPVKLPSVVVCAGSFDTSIALSGRLAVIESDTSICVMDCSNASLPVPLARYEALPNVNGLGLTSTHMVMPMARGSLALIDREDTQERSFFWDNRDEIHSTGFAVKDDYAYSTTCSFVIGIGDVTAFDISDPANPTLAGIEGWVGCFGNPTLGSTHGWLSDFNALMSIDISDPTQPAVVGQFTVPSVMELVVAEPYLYAVTSASGMMIFDANPAGPSLVGPGVSEAALGGQPLQIAVSNGYAYVVISGPVGGMRVVDVGDPLTPTIVGNLEIAVPNSGSGQIALHDSFVYLMATDGILRVVDVSDPTDPLEVGNISVGNIFDLQVDPPFIYALGAGSQVLKFETDLSTDVDARTRASFVLGQNYPNPFNPSTNISFELRSPSHAVIEIFDARGSRVRRLIDETMTTGSHTVEWNGRDDTGGTVGSGVYFYRLTADGHSLAKKMVILK